VPSSEADLQQQRDTVAERQAVLQSRANPFTVNDINAAQSAVDQARAQVAVAQGNIDQMVVSAPFSGVVASRLLAPGAFAGTQNGILTLVSDNVEIHITVEESRLAALRPGQSVTLELPAYPGVAFSGRVTSIAPTGDPRAHTFDVTVVPNGSDDRLRPGMFADVEVTVAEKSDALLVPRDAVVQQGDRSVVYVAADGRASARRVELGLQNENSVEILSGIEEGEQVVTVGQNTLRDGQAVQVPAAAAPRGGGGQQRQR